MRVSLFIALIMFFVHTTTHAADENLVTVPFPQSSLDSTAHNFFCNAILGTVINGTSQESKIVTITKNIKKSGIFAKVHHPADKFVLEISDQVLYLFNRREFENGKSMRDFPLTIIENSENNLVAIARGIIEPVTIEIVTLNRKNGIMSLTIVNSVDLLMLSDSPRIETMYLTCGARKD